jgi:hypothetical protein
MIFEVMKPQIAIGLRGVAAAYGEVLLKVWKDAPAEEDEVDTPVSIQVIMIKFIQFQALLLLLSLLFMITLFIMFLLC